MTRETRIGLLVGLLFIIMFGLVLSELAGTGSPTPGGGKDDLAAITSTPVVEDVGPTFSDTPAPPPVAAPVPVPHAPDLTGGPSAPPPAPTVALLPAVSPSVPATEAPPVAALENLVPVREVPGSSPAVRPPAGAPSGPSLPPSPSTPPAPPAPALAGAAKRTYTVLASDSLRKIARKVYGSTNEKEYKRIFQANKTVLRDEASVTPGMVLVIPALPTASPSPSSGAPGPSRTDAALAVNPQPAMDEVDLHEFRRVMDSRGGSDKPAAAPREGARTSAAGGRGSAVDKSAADKPAAGVAGEKPAAGDKATASGGKSDSGKDAAKDPAKDASALAKGEAKAPDAAKTPAKNHRTYTTRQGDSLVKIAREMLHDGTRSGVLKIVNANKGKISDPNRVPTGVQLEIPS